MEWTSDAIWFRTVGARCNHIRRIVCKGDVSMRRLLIHLVGPVVEQGNLNTDGWERLEDQTYLQARQALTRCICSSWTVVIVYGVACGKGTS